MSTAEIVNGLERIFVHLARQYLVSDKTVEDSPEKDPTSRHA